MATERAAGLEAIFGKRGDTRDVLDACVSPADPLRTAGELVALADRLQREFYDAGDIKPLYDAAIRLYKALLARAPGDIPLLLALGSAAYGRLDKKGMTAAVAAFDRVLAAGPHAGAAYGKFQALAWTGADLRSDEAGALLDLAYELDPKKYADAPELRKDWEARRAAASILELGWAAEAALRDGRAEGALALFEKFHVACVAPGSGAFKSQVADALVGRGRALILAERLDEAGRALSEAEPLYGTNEVKAARAHRAWAELHAARGMPREARERLEKAVTGDPYHQDAWLRLAVLRAADEDPVPAGKALRAALRKNCDEERRIRTRAEFKAWLAARPALASAAGRPDVRKAAAALPAK